MVEQYTITLSEGLNRVKNRVRKQRNASDGTWYYLGLVGQIGFSIALPIAGGAIAGSLIDGKFGWYPRATILGLGAGFVLSAIGFVRVVLKILRKQK